MLNLNLEVKSYIRETSKKESFKEMEGCNSHMDSLTGSLAMVTLMECVRIITAKDSITIIQNMASIEIKVIISIIMKMDYSNLE